MSRSSLGFTDVITSYSIHYTKLYELEDITGEIAADSELDYRLQRVIDTIQFSLGELNKQMALVCALPGIGTAACLQHRRGVEHLTTELEKHLALARELYSRHRLAFGSRENVLTETLLLILQKELRQRFPLEAEVETASSCWLKIDSYAIVQIVTRITSYNVCYTKLLRPKSRIKIFSCI